MIAPFGGTTTLLKNCKVNVATGSETIGVDKNVPKKNNTNFLGGLVYIVRTVHSRVLLFRHEPIMRT